MKANAELTQDAPICGKRKKAVMPSKEYLQECLEYQPETGTLFWKRRPVHHFKGEVWARIWNTRRAGKQAGNRARRQSGAINCIYVEINTVALMAHRVVLAMHGVEIPDGFEVDHINGNTLDNRMCNLRVVDHHQNCQNQKPRIKKGGFPKGVYQPPHLKGRFIATITARGKQTFLGAFGTLDEAIAARRMAEEELHGEYSFYQRGSVPR